MITIRDDEGLECEVVTKEDFRAYRIRNVFAYILVAVGATLGVWGLTNHSNADLTGKINTFAATSCFSQTMKTSNTFKYNDLVDDLIASRSKQLDLDTANKDIKAINLDNAAIRRYQADKIIPPTKAQCEVPILKG